MSEVTYSLQVDGKEVANGTLNTGTINQVNGLNSLVAVGKDGFAIALTGFSGNVGEIKNVGENGATVVFSQVEIDGEKRTIYALSGTLKRDAENKVSFSCSGEIQNNNTATKAGKVYRLEGFLVAEDLKNIPPDKPQPTTKKRYLKYGVTTRKGENFIDSTFFFYNDKMKLIKMTGYNDDHEKVVTEFTYNEKGLVDKINFISTEEEQPKPISFFYDKNNRLVYGLQGKAVRIDYYYQGSKVVKTTISVNMGKEYVVMTKNEMVYSGDNVVEYKSYDNVNGAFVLTEHYEDEYDNKNNPLFGLGLGNAFLMGSEGGYLMVCKNNPIKHTIHKTDMEDETPGVITTRYKYNEDNYPVEGTSSDGEYTKMVYH